MGYVQTNSLMRNSQLVNSSIIINVFINARNDPEMFLKVDPEFSFPVEETSEAPLDPLWDASRTTDGDYQKIDTGLLRIGKEIGDRYYRPNPLIQPAELSEE
jgi:hypothetical protein